MSSGDGDKPEAPEASETEPETAAELPDAVLASIIEQEKGRAADPGISEDRESQTYLEIFKDSEAQRQRHREFLTPALRNIAQIWVVAVLLILIWQGFGSRIGFFGLSDKVLIALITTTTANVLGLFYIAVRYLYANPDFKPPRRGGHAE